jgi:hypothetical protein
LYQLRRLALVPPYWSRSSRYPVTPYNPRNAREGLTPVHRLVDLGAAAVPTLIEALDDRSFTRTSVASFNGTDLPRAMRVSDFAQGILEFMAGRSFFPRRADDGRLVDGTTREQAEAWWAEARRRGVRCDEGKCCDPK